MPPAYDPLKSSSASPGRQLLRMVQPLKFPIKSGIKLAEFNHLIGLSGMAAGEGINRIFAEYHPCRVEVVDKSSCLVSFASRADCVRMMIGMTKPLRRFRVTRAAEDGELTDSDGEEEEGQIKREKGDDVALVADVGDKPKRIRQDVVEVDVDAIDIPHGRWRVVTAHVPERRFMIARFAKNTEIAEARKVAAVSNEDDGSRKRKKETDEQGFTYSWSTEQKVRPGLNVFDDKGNELEWDYEHDTRFFDDPAAAAEDNEKSATVDVGAPQAKVVKGRGAKKGSFLFGGGGGTLASDELDETTSKRRHISARLTTAEEVEEDEEDVWQHKPASPTPQPWDRPKGRLANRVSRM
ncbi:unnamed protein product [Heligmosomoides polygyrus]|uniref:RRM domain-containing protein n=1 Tax=Heligmosomoides polygyrus TaxID=6339 RepID=A0A3P7YVT6_HELPZ|nr:unnamed protein product [Heligmosomoides polygyrus]